MRGQCVASLCGAACWRSSLVLMSGARERAQFATMSVMAGLLGGWRRNVPLTLVGQLRNAYLTRLLHLDGAVPGCVVFGFSQVWVGVS